MHRPFESLDEILKENGVLLSPPRQLAPCEARVKAEVELAEPALSDAELFDQAMKDVKALGWSSTPLHPRPPMELQPQNDEQDALRALEDFIRHGNVEIEQTAEYIEGAIHPRG